MFLRPVFRVGLISSSKFWWGLPEKGGPSSIEISWEGGGEAELKGVTSDVILVSNYHGCKEEAINLIPQYLKDIIQKLVNHHI